MVFSSEDKIFTKNLVLLKGYSSRRLIKEFPQKGWNKNGLDVLLRKIRKTASVDTIALLRCETPSFIGPELWPANSPDLNPVDYRIWGLIQERVYQTAIRNIDELKERLIVVWAELKQSVIDH